MRAVALGLLAAAATFFFVAAAQRDAEDEPTRPAASAAAGREVFARIGCGNCHTLAAANSNGQMGPNLDARLANHTAASLRAQILDPYPGTAGAESFGAMPTDFGQRLSGEELDQLVAFLLSARR
jgi:mono/diheme cytochrome c family protein